jgi:hypothetical protein
MFACIVRWQTPIGSQQMVTQLIDLMRSSVTKHASFDKVNPYSHDAAAKQEREYSPVPLPPVDAETGSPPMMMCLLCTTIYQIYQEHGFHC